MTLYEMMAYYKDLQYRMTHEDPDIAQAAYEELAVVESNIGEKSENYAKMIRNLTADRDAFKAESARLADKAKVCDNAINRLKEALKEAMLVLEKPECKTSIGTFRITQNPPSCKVVDIMKIPKEFIVEQEPKVAAKEILAHYKETGEIPDGVDIVREESIRFR